MLRKGRSKSFGSFEERTGAKQEKGKAFEEHKCFAHTKNKERRGKDE
jgi:hypothetical protein